MGKRIVAVRADSAAYQAAIFNACEEKQQRFAIGADLDAAVKGLITEIPEAAWVQWRDAEIADKSVWNGFEQPKVGPQDENQGRFS